MLENFDLPKSAGVKCEAAIEKAVLVSFTRPGGMNLQFQRRKLVGRKPRINAQGVTEFDWCWVVMIDRGTWLRRQGQATAAEFKTFPEAYEAAVACGLAEAVE